MEDLKPLSPDGFLVRRFSSGEFISGVFAVLLLCLFFPRLSLEAWISGLSACADAYIISRTLMKIGRHALRKSSLSSTEYHAHILVGQIPVMVAFIAGAAPLVCARLVVLNSAVFMLSRGAVKSRLLSKMNVLGR